jgi:hypothetical protein
MSNESHRWRPQASFAHPLFAGGVLVLALNDHVFKGSGLLPSVVTGKLSDVAGLLVAPLLCAWLFAARARRGWLVAHLAVGVAFALAQLAPVASALEEVLRGLGVGARLWADPTDWLALPALLVSYRVLGPRRSSVRHPRRTLIGLAALVLCTATPAPGGQQAPRYPFPPGGAFESDVYVRHMGSTDRTMSVRRLRDEVEVDCDGLLERPHLMLEGGDFGDEQTWTLARGDAIPLWDRRGGAVDRECYAVKLSVNGQDWLVTWRHGAPALRDVEIRLEPEDDAEPDAVALPNEGTQPPRAPAGVTVHRPE